MTKLDVRGSAEWRGYWYLPFIAALGYSISTFQSYAIGPFIIPLQQEFDWTRAQVSSGVALCNLVAAILMTAIGPTIDRYGPRAVGLIGVVLMTAAFALLSTATGTMFNWWLHWLLIAVCSLLVQGTVWTGVVVSRFAATRGIAIAITISGNGVAAAILPPLGTWLIARHGVRGGFVGIGIVWASVLLPSLFFFFRGAADERIAKEVSHSNDPPLPGVTVREGLRLPAFYKLIFVGFCFSCTVIGIAIHFVPILVSFGATPTRAAGASALVGVFSIAGRLLTGLLLDRLPAHLVGVGTYLIPVIGAVSLLVTGRAPFAQLLAASSFGLTLGAETDILIYLVTGHFGVRKFGTLMSGVFASIALGAAVGPLAAGAVFDMTGNYRLYLLSTIALAMVSGVILATLRCSATSTPVMDWSKFEPPQQSEPIA